MWADTLMAAERGHLLRLAWWAGASVLVGAILLSATWRRAPRPMLVWHFAVQSVAWGLVDLAIVGWGWGQVIPRDVNGYAALREFLWLNIGLDVGYAGVGATLAIAGYALARRLALVGAGVGVVVQGVALAILDGWLVAILNRLQVA